MGDLASWQNLNPGWTWRFWTDADLLAFFQTERPELLDLFLGYSRGVQRADLARYVLLHHFGGVYADVDTRCLAPLEPLVGDPRVVLCEEPRVHAAPALVRGLDRMWFNGTMASPAGHPFWTEVIARCRRMALRKHRDVLETTGPLLLSGVVVDWPDPADLALHGCPLFAGTTAEGETSGDPAYGPYGDLRLSDHLWAGSWFRQRSESWLRRKIGRLRTIRHALTRNPQLDLAGVRAGLDMALLDRPLPERPDADVTILIPVRNAAAFLPRLFDLLDRLEHPKHRLRIVFGHGDSTDESRDLLHAYAARQPIPFAALRVTDLPRNAPHSDRQNRWHPRLQRRRRAALAGVRNDLLAATEDLPSDWILWMDADLADFPSDIIARLLAAHAPVVTPDCVTTPDGPSFDLNAFLEIGTPSVAEYHRRLRDGILQPPRDWWFRRHLHDLRYLSRVPLHGVGGTMLLVKADIHRAGLRFPEIPYRDLLETEAFGHLCRDLGITPIGLPQVQVIHASD